MQDLFRFTRWRATWFALFVVVIGALMSTGSALAVRPAQEAVCAAGWMGQYNLITIDDLSTSSDVEGTTFVGGDFVGTNSANFANQISGFPATSPSLEIAGNIVSGNPVNIQNGSLVVKPGTSISLPAPAVGFDVNGRRFNINAGNSGGNASTSNLNNRANQISSELLGWSSTLSGLSANNTITVPASPSALNFNVNTKDSNGVAIFNVSGADVFNNSNVQQIEIFNNVNATAIIINVSGSNISWNHGNKVGNWLTNTGRAQTLWNFYEATTVNFGSKNFMGALLAPLASVTTTGNIDGATAVLSLTTSAEVHLPLLAIDCDDIPTDPTGPGGNQNCPAGTIEVAKFNYQGGQYVLDGNNNGNVAITNANATGGNWSSNLFISAIVVKGGNDSTVDSVSPAATSGTFSNANVPTVGQGNIPDISNIKFCAQDPQPEPETGSITVYKQVLAGSEDQLFDFTLVGENVSENFELSDNSDPDDGEFNDLPVGSYTVSEVLANMPENWSYTGASCATTASFPPPLQNVVAAEFGNGDGSLTVNLAAGQHLYCHFGNTYEEPEPPVTLERLIPDCLYVADNTYRWRVRNQNDTSVDFTLTNPAGNVVFASGTAAPNGDTVVYTDATITTSPTILRVDGVEQPNGRKNPNTTPCRGTIIVEKVVTVANGSEQPPANAVFNFEVDGQDIDEGFPLEDGQTHEISVIAGVEYTIAEILGNNADRWSVSNDCNGALTVGVWESETCTFTNEYDYTPPPPVSLNLTAECVVGDTLYWRVTGDDDVDNVDFTWNGPGANDGSGQVDAGERFYFTTQDAGDANTTIIRWFDPADNRYEQKVKAHNNTPCVYHVSFEKEWTGGDAPDLDGAVLLTAESSLGTATCTSDDGALSCVYSTGDDLHVPFGESYTVNESVPAGWNVVEGVGSGFTGIEGFDESALPDALVYDVAGDRYCESDPNGLEKYCTHTVVNEIVEQDLCEMNPDSILVNGCFEEPVVSGGNWNIYDSVPGWEINWLDGNPCPVTNIDPSLELQTEGTLGNVDVINGDQYAELDSDCEGPNGDSNPERTTVEISQTLATIPGHRYEVSFYFAQRPNHVDQNLRVTIDGVEYISEAAPSGWELRTFEFVATSTETVIAFADTGFANSYGVLLDCINVLDLGPEPEPELGLIKVFKYYDVNDNGSWFFELPLSGFEFVVYDELGNQVAPSQTTGLLGFASFLLPADTYTVCELLPAGWANTEPGTIDATYNQPCVEVHLGEYDLDIVNFGNREADPGSIRVTKFNDVNLSGDRNNGEDRLEGWTFEVYEGDTPVGSPIRSNETNSNGRRNFGNLEAGTYTVCEVMQEGWTNTTPLCQTVEVVSGERTDIEFGNIELPPVTDTCGAIAVVEFNQGLDRNYNSIVGARSNPLLALGAPQNNDTINFVSLGFGGELILQLDGLVVDDNGSDDDLFFIETSFGNQTPASYPETAEVFISLLPTGPWTSLGQVTLDGGFDFPGDGLSAVYVRLVDVSNRASFGSGVADGYDLDGILCEEPDGEIVITKRVNWNGAEVDENQEFVLCVNGNNLAQPLCDTVNYDGGSVSFVVEPGNYSVYEQDPGDEWTVSGQNGNVSVASGQTRRITITNAHDEPTVDVTLVKTIDWNGNDVNNAVSFELCIGDLCGIANYANNYMVVIPNVSLGVYTLSETPAANWTVSFPNGTSADVTLGGNNTFTIHNTADAPPPPPPPEEQVGRIVVTKYIVNPPANTPLSFTICIANAVFPTDNANQSACYVVTGDGQQVAWDVVIPEGQNSVSYVVSENNPGANWTVTGSGASVTVAPDQTAYHSITNTYNAPPPPTCAGGVGPQSDLIGWIEINGGTATGYVQNVGNTTGCVYPIGLAAYNMFNENIDEQQIFSSDVNGAMPIEPGQTVTLSVALPECAVQVDLFYGSLISPVFNGQRYGSRLLAHVWYNRNNFCVDPNTVPAIQEQPPVENNIQEPPVEDVPPINEEEQPLNEEENQIPEENQETGENQEGGETGE